MVYNINELQEMGSNDFFVGLTKLSSSVSFKL